MSASPFRRFWHRVLVWSGPAVLVLLAIYTFCWWGSERLWFESLGYGAHFGRLFLWRAGAFGAGALFFALWLGFNAQVAWRNAAARAVPLSFFQSDDATRLIPLEDKLQLDRYRRRVTVGTVLLLSFGAGLGFSARYGLLVRAFSVIGTGQREGASNLDLAFFLFSLPFYQWLSRVLLGAIMTALVIVSAIYLYEETLLAPADSAASGLKSRVSRANQPAARHLAILWSLLLLWKGADCLLSVPLSFVSSGNVAARVFDPVDIRLGWTSAALFAFSSPLVALLSGLSLSSAPRGRVFGAGAIWMLGVGAIPFLLPLVAGRSPSDPDWKSALSRHIQSTRRAWGLESTERRSLVLAPDAPFHAVARQSGVAADNFTPLAFWPASSAKDALNERLASHGANFRVAQVFLEREGDSLRYVGLGVPQIPDGDAPWRARHQRASRGLWVQMEAARVAPDGAPIFWPDIAAPALVGAPRALETSTRARNSIEPLPPIETSSPDDADEWIFTATTVQEFPGEANSDADSSAARGVSLRSLGARWMTATRFFEPPLLRAANAGDRMTWHRGAAMRCRALAPFLDWRESEARPVLLSDADAANSTKNEAEATARLFYLVPGLIWSDDYPDSATPAPVGTAPPGANYGRHIALGLVDARSGAVTLYALDEDEPFMALYNRAFPALFRPPTSLPDSIRAAIRPSAALLGAQTLIWARYHHASSDRESLAWAAQGDNYRPLFSPQEGAFPLASQSAGDWQCIAYARPEGQIGGGAVSPLISILGADERDFVARGARVRFVEWKARVPVHLPDLLAEPTLRLVANRPALPPPTRLGIAPRFDARGNAIGLVAARGEAKLLPQKTPDARRQIRLETQMQISGGDEALPAAPLSPRRTLENLAARQQMKTARAAWHDLQVARRKGDWEAVARAEKRLDEALGENAPASGAAGTR